MVLVSSVNGVTFTHDIIFLLPFSVYFWISGRLRTASPFRQYIIPPKRKYNHEIIWFTAPFSQNVKIWMLRLVDKPSFGYIKLVNKRNIRVFFRCVPSVRNIFSKTTETSAKAGSSCRVHGEFSVDDWCNTKSLRLS